jgi:hypothetical protein
MTARVRGVMAARTAAGERFWAVPVDVREHGLAPAMATATRRRDEGARRHDDLVAGSDAGGLEREVERERAVRERDARAERRSTRRTRPRTP